MFWEDLLCVRHQHKCEPCSMASPTVLCSGNQQPRETGSPERARGSSRDKCWGASGDSNPVHWLQDTLCYFHQAWASDGRDLHWALQQELCTLIIETRGRKKKLKECWCHCWDSANNTILTSLCPLSKKKKKMSLRLDLRGEDRALNSHWQESSRKVLKTKMCGSSFHMWLSFL